MRNLLTYSHWEHTDSNPIRKTFYEIYHYTTATRNPKKPTLVGIFTKNISHLCTARFF